MEKIRILQLNGRSDFGGGPKNVFRLLEKIDRNKCDVSIACPDEKPYFEKLQALKGIRVFPLNLRKLNPGNLFQLIGIVQQNQIQIVHSQGKAAGIWSRLLKFFFPRLIVVHHFRGIHYQQYANWKKWLYFQIERLQSLFTTQIIHVSDSEAAEALRLKLCKPQQQIIIANGIELFPENPFSKAAARKQLQLPDTPILMVIARFSIQKNLGQSLRIIRELVDVGEKLHFVVVGGPDDQSLENVQQEIKELGLSTEVILAGEQANIAEWLCAADIYLTTARWEGLPTAVLEAMSVGLPVVASDVVGNKSVISPGENGYLLPLQDTHQFTNVIRELLAYPDRREKMGQEAKKSVMRDYSVDQMVTKHEQLYEQLISRQQGNVTKGKNNQK